LAENESGCMAHQGSDVGEGVTMPLQIAPSWEAERPCAVAAAMDSLIFGVF